MQSLFFQCMKERDKRGSARRVSQSLLRHNISPTVTLEQCRQTSREFLFINAAVAQFCFFCEKENEEQNNGNTVLKRKKKLQSKIDSILNVQ